MARRYTVTLRHGHAQKGKVTREYRTWLMMINRCHNPNANGYHRYRGISVCRRWRDSFEKFLEDMGSRPLNKSIDRINTNGNYTPRNCRWATKTEQAHNRRSSRNYSLHGKTQNLAAWARELGIPYDTLYYRLTVRGLPFEEATSQ